MESERKVAVITGASQGIGAALLKAYRARGYRVVAVARSVERFDDAEILAVPGDIADVKTAERAISDGVALFGRVDTLVNNAGIFIAKPFTEYTEADYAAILGSISPASFTSRSAPWSRWRSARAATSCRSQRRWSIAPTPKFRPFWRR
jgi:NAD(P)-dependent dehydrogenase (short-subunit alcohol dehydrogenase family)